MPWSAWRPVVCMRDIGPYLVLLVLSSVREVRAAKVSIQESDVDRGSSGSSHYGRDPSGTVSKSAAGREKRTPAGLLPGGAASGDHDKKLHQALVHVARSGGLDNEDIFVADRLADGEGGLLVGVVEGDGASDFDAEPVIAKRMLANSPQPTVFGRIGSVGRSWSAVGRTVWQSCRSARGGCGR